MSFSVTCDHCGQTVAAEAALAGEAVECPACGGAFTLPLLVDLTAPPPAGPEVYAPASAFDRRRNVPRSTGFAGLGPWPVYAAVAAVVFAVLGIVSPIPIRVGLLVLPAAAVGLLIWELPTALRWVPTPRRRPDVAATVVRAGLTLAAGGGLAVWGLMVHGRDVLTLDDRPSARPTPVTPSPPAVTDVPSVPPPPTFPRPTGVPVAASMPPAAAAIADARPRREASTGPAVVTDMAAQRDADAAAAAAGEADVQRREQLSLIHLRALSAAIAAYAKAHGTYPPTIADLPRTRDLRAALRSPFDVPGQTPSGYVVVPGSRSPSKAAAGLTVVYDAAEMAARGTAVGITADGRPSYVDADQLAEERAKWAEH